MPFPDPRNIFGFSCPHSSLLHQEPGMLLATVMPTLPSPKNGYIRSMDREIRMLNRHHDRTFDSRNGIINGHIITFEQQHEFRSAFLNIALR